MQSRPGTCKKIGNGNISTLQKNVKVYHQTKRFNIASVSTGIGSPNKGVAIWVCQCPRTNFQRKVTTISLTSQGAPDHICPHQAIPGNMPPAPQNTKQDTHGYTRHPNEACEDKIMDCRPLPPLQLRTIAS